MEGFYTTTSNVAMYVNMSSEGLVCAQLLILTNLLAVLFSFEAHNLQDARVGDVRDDVCDSLPHF